MKVKNILIFLFILTIYSVFVNANNGYHNLEIEIEYLEDTMTGIDESHKDQLSSMTTTALSKFRKALKVKDSSKSVTVKENDCENRAKADKVYKNVDYLLYVEFKADGSCVPEKATMAHAVFCKREHIGVRGQPDFEWTRPIVGTMSICRQKFLERREYQRKEWISTIQHEMIHALVFHRDLFKAYQAENGALRRTGEPKSVPLPVGVGEITVVPGIVEEVIRDDWLTSKGKVQHKVYMMKTPKVVQMVREYFNCPTLEGAEIETQGGSGTAGSHWEKRVLEHETMTGASTQVFALSNITLALFEDSGWYQANYSAADSMTWGKGRGCDFVKNSCLDLVNSGVVKPFCKKDSPKFSCSDDLTQKEMCNLAQDMSLPAPYNYGFVGRFELSDWCPYYSKYEQNMNTKTDGTADSTCNHPGNMPKGTEKQYLLEIYSRASRCFELNGRPTQTKKSLTSTETRTLGEFTGCYEHKCKNGTLYVKTRHSKFYPCYYAGQLVHVNKKLVDRSRVEFDIICPPCEKLCSSCSTAPPLKLEYVGDKKTAGFKTSITMYLTLLISVYVM